MDETYGGITRKGVGPSPSYQSEGGQLTPKMLQDAFEAIKRMDEAEEEWQREFYNALRPHQHLATEDVNCYCAIYRLLQSSRAPLHPKEYEALMAIVKARGINLWPSEPPACETASPSD